MSHQDRRLPLPADYQFPTHGVDCDCPPCRNRVTENIGYHRVIVPGPPVYFQREAELVVTSTAYGWGV